jgi:hypothetical protein
MLYTLKNGGKKLIGYTFRVGYTYRASNVRNIAEFSQLNFLFKENLFKTLQAN